MLGKFAIGDTSELPTRGTPLLLILVCETSVQEYMHIALLMLRREPPF